VVFIIYSIVSSPSKTANYPTPSELKEVEEVIENISETDLSIKMINALKENGYNIYEGVGFSIYSPDRQIVSLNMYDINLHDKKTTTDIENIVNRVAQNNNFNPFTVDLNVMEK
jgi:hypothetical protein